MIVFPIHKLVILLYQGISNMKFSKIIQLSFFLATALFANKTDFGIMYHGADQTSTMYSSQLVIEFASKALNNPFLESEFYRGRIDVYINDNDKLSSLVVLLFSSVDFGGERYKINYDADTVTSIIKNYAGIERSAELSDKIRQEEEDCECPDSSVEALFTNGIGYNGHYPIVIPALEYAASVTSKQGLKTVSIGDAWHPVSSLEMKGWLKCPNLKIWGNIGHGVVGTIYTSFKWDDPGLDYTYFETLNGSLKNKVLLWCTCLVHSEPMKSAMEKAGPPYWWTAGDSVKIPAADDMTFGGEIAFIRWIDSVIVAGKEMGSTMDEMNKKYVTNPVHDYKKKFGYTGYSTEPHDYYWEEVLNGGTTSIASSNSIKDGVSGIEVVEKKGELLVTALNQTSIQTELLNIQGKILENRRYKLSEGKAVLSFSKSLSPGFYLVKISVPDKTVSYPMIIE